MTLELTTIKSLRETVRGWRAAGERIALVPTMGALHPGHMALAEEGRKVADRVIVSIFVNPTQFGPNEDFNRYPRPREADLTLLNKHGIDAAWMPDVSEIYPQGFSTSVQAGSAANGLETDFRPGHFNGVATVVAKLLLQVMPDVALFGEKDYQQLCVINQLVRDLDIPVTIQPVPTIREADGLALSSRNQYLSAEERQIAPSLYATLRLCAEQLLHTQTVIPGSSRDPAGQQTQVTSMPHGQTPAQGRGDTLEELLAWGKQKIIAAGFSKIDYLEWRDGRDLSPVTQYRKDTRLLAAAWLGKTRLIDNIPVE